MQKSKLSILKQLLKKKNQTQSYCRRHGKIRRPTELHKVHLDQLESYNSKTYQL